MKSTTVGHEICKQASTSSNFLRSLAKSLAPLTRSGLHKRLRISRSEALLPEVHARFGGLPYVKSTYQESYIFKPCIFAFVYVEPEHRSAPIFLFVGPESRPSDTGSGDSRSRRPVLLLTQTSHGLAYVISVYSTLGFEAEIKG